jgi:hypothetical protein
MTEKPRPPIDFAEAMRRLRERHGIPAIPLPLPDALPPPKPHNETDRDEETP